MAGLQEEITRRRTFAIISHPDAGKTTLTEKFLLYGGAIAQAGEVKGKRARAATSDWMEIEKQRGISVTSWRLPRCAGATQKNKQQASADDGSALVFLLRRALSRGTITC